MDKNYKSTKGITLIALVITIIVLLILAGVSIAMLTGQNGILTKANESKTTNEEKTALEQMKLVLNEWQIEKHTGSQTLRGFLESKTPKTDTNPNGTGELDAVTVPVDGTFEIEKSGYTATVSEDGILNENTISKVGPRPDVSDVKLEVKSSMAIGSYINYNVKYTDMYSNYEFTKDDGWRVLDPGTYDESTGKYSNVKLISTGIPAKLDYGDIANAPWAGTVDQIKNYTSKFYASSSSTHYNMYVAAGLYYNFGKIKFSQGANNGGNTGYYLQVNNKTTGSGNLDETEFLTGDASEVHNLTMYELNEARTNRKGNTTSYGKNEADANSTSRITTSNDAATGLFYLRGLGDKYNGYSSKSPFYWLASPVTYDEDNVWRVECNGEFNSIDGSMHGVRPVVSLKSNVQIDIVGN